MSRECESWSGCRRTAHGMGWDEVVVDGRMLYLWCIQYTRVGVAQPHSSDYRLHRLNTPEEAVQTKEKF